MKEVGKILIYLVDDDALFLKSLELEFMQYDYIIIKTFATGEECLKMLNKKPDIIVLDYYLNGFDKNAINGLETLDKIKAINAALPVIMLSAQDSITVAVNCMKHNAHDYIVKSETAFLRLQKTITSFFDIQKIEKTLNWYMERYNF